MSRRLADGLKRGVWLDNLPQIIRETKELAKTRPGVGWPFVNILDEMERRWEPYRSSGTPKDEYELVRDTVCPRMLDILKRLAEVPGYDPAADVDELKRAYEAIT